MPLTEVSKIEQCIGCENRIGTDDNKMSEPPGGQHCRKGKPGTWRTGFGLFRQLVIRTAEDDQRPIGERLPHQRVMQTGKFLTGTAGGIIKNTEPAGNLHSGDLLFLPEELRWFRIDQLPVTGRTDFPDPVLEIFQTDPVEQTFPAEMKHDIESRSDSMEKLFLPG